MQIMQFATAIAWSLSAPGLFRHDTAVVAADLATFDGDGDGRTAWSDDPRRFRRRRAAADDAADDDREERDRTITVRGGVLLAPPFAIAGNDDGSSDDDDPDDASGHAFTGFQGDLIRRLQTFASIDNYTLHFELELSPYQQYGAALDLVANDCNTTANANTAEDCGRYDLIVGDYYCNGPRSIRVDFSPTWLRTTMSTIKTIEGDYTTLTQLQAGGGTACVPKGAYLSTVVMGKFPGAKYLDCPSPDECIAWLKEGRCSLYADDELALRYRALDDPTTEVTGEQFNTQYIVWPISYRSEQRKVRLLKKWMYDSVSNATLDLLSYKYFTLKLCPLGLSGENCDENCDPKHGVSDRMGKCICHSTKWSGKDCSIEVKENLNTYPLWEVGMCYAFFGINMLACIVCAIWIFWKRHNDLVRVSQPFFLNLVLFGCVISSSSIIPLAQQSEGQGPVPACFVFPWLYCIGFSVTFGTLFAKIKRVYTLFKASAHAERVVVTKTQTFIDISVTTSVDIVICAIWTIFDRLKWSREITSADQFGEPLESAGFCSSEHWTTFVVVIGVWHLLLLLGGCHLCYLTRHISKKFVESRYMLLAMVSHLQIYLISIPVLVLVGNDPKSSLFIRAMVIWINDFAIICIIFGSLILAVHRKKGGSINIQGAMQTFANRRASSATPGGSSTSRPLAQDRSAMMSTRVSQIRLRAASTAMHGTSTGNISVLNSIAESDHTSKHAPDDASSESDVISDGYQTCVDEHPDAFHDNVKK